MIPKFRVFCKRHKCIEEVFSITFLGDDIKIEAECNGSDFVLMQSTGLHDNTKFEDLSAGEQLDWFESGKTEEDWKGREIFEGSVVKHSDGEYSYIGYVDRDCYVFWIRGIDPDDNFNFEDISDTSTGIAQLEVIGDMYSNPELLEVAK